MANHIRWLDLETTGTNPATDRIVQLAILDEEGTVLFEQIVDPGIPIPAEATAVHGITDADVADEPHFIALAPDVQGLLTYDDPIVAGYNSRRFDVPLVDAELRRAGMAGLDLATIREIDVYLAWLALEPRTLEGAVRRWLPHAAAGFKGHVAQDDAVWTRLVAREMMLRLGLGPDELERLSKPADEVDRFGRFRRREDGVIVFAFGKYEGVPAASQPGYLRWILGTDFAEETKEWTRRILAGAA